MKSTTVLLTLVLAGVAACGPKVVVGEAKISITGSLTHELTGPIVNCGAHTREGGHFGGAYNIMTDAVSLSVINAGDMWIVSVAAGAPVQDHFQTQATTGVQATADNSVVTLDLDIKHIPEGPTVHVKGTMTCPPLPSRPH